MQLKQILIATRVSLFPGFSTSRETGNFVKFPGNPGKFPGSRKSSGFPGFGKFPGKFPGNFDHFDIIYDFQHFRSNF